MASMVVKFDLSSIPVGARITYAEIWLSQRGRDGRWTRDLAQYLDTRPVYKLTTDWDEDSPLTWEVGWWETDGGDFDRTKPIAKGYKLYGDTTTILNKPYYEWIVTTAVQEMIDSSTNYGFIFNDLRGQDTTEHKGANRSETWIARDNKRSGKKGYGPKLMVKYEIPVSIVNEVDNKSFHFSDILANKNELSFISTRSGVSNVSIFSITGQQLLQKEILLTKGSNHINVEQTLSPGMYLIQIDNFTVKVRIL